MKKLISSKVFIAGTLAVLCVAILTVCVLWGKDKHDFIPDDPVPLGGIESWTENHTPSDGAAENTGHGSDFQPPSVQPADPLEDFPKVVEENGDEVVIDFTDPDPHKAPPPETPNKEAVSGKDGHAASDTPAADKKPNDSGKPVPGSMNDKGEVYDAAFGWIKPAEVIQESIDSDGDPNKIIGNMN